MERGRGLAAAFLGFVLVGLDTHTGSIDAREQTTGERAPAGLGCAGVMIARGRARWVKPKFLGKADDGAIIVDSNGRPKLVAPGAFELAQDEDGLSVTCLQFFGNDRVTQLPAAAEAFRSSIPSGNISPKSAFTIARISAVLAAGRDHGTKLRIIHDPVTGNEGHAEVRRYPAESGLLQLVLANDVFGERYLYGALRQPGWQP